MITGLRPVSSTGALSGDLVTDDGSALVVVFGTVERLKIVLFHNHAPALWPKVRNAAAEYLTGVPAKKKTARNGGNERFYRPSRARGTR